MMKAGKIPGSWQGAEKVVEHEDNGDNSWSRWSGLQRAGKENGRIGDPRKDRNCLDQLDYLECSIVI